MKIITRQEAKKKGFKSYFTGLSCLKGHTDSRRVDNGACMECRRAIKNRWFKNGITQDDKEKSKPLPSKDFLRECFIYNMDTGVLVWDRPYHHFSTERAYKIYMGKYNGREAGFLNKPTGYREIRINSELYKAHRLVYKFVHGVDPLLVDHINADRSDNRISNLRSVTSKINAERS